MINSIIVTNYVGDRIKIEMTRPELSGFAVRNIDGLGPVKANINTTEVSTYDGGLYNSSRLSSRNIVFDLAFVNNYGESIEDIRHRAYKFFQTKTKVTIRFETSNRVLETEGYVESNEPTIFSKEEGCKVSIICPFPYFHSIDEHGKVDFSSVEPLFEFPFSNESLSEDLIELSSIRTVHEQLITYDGDAEVGIGIWIQVGDEVKNITIYNTGTRERMTIYTDKVEEILGTGIKAKDEIEISTVKGKKYIVLVRDGVAYNLLHCIDKNADWFQLRNGDNIFAYTAESGAENLKFSIMNDVIYKGV